MRLMSQLTHINSNDFRPADYVETSESSAYHGAKLMRSDFFTRVVNKYFFRKFWKVYMYPFTLMSDYNDRRKHPGFGSIL